MMLLAAAPKILSIHSIWWQIAILVILSYFFGNINFAVIISKLKNKDIREEGSGNPGTLNMSRTFGLEIGLLTLLLDMLKGAIPAWLGWFFFRNAVFSTGTDFIIGDMVKPLCGLAVVLGHIYPVFYKFKGGKGVASTIGVYFASHPLFGILMVALAITFVYFTELGSVGSFIAITPPALWYAVEMIVKYHGAAAPTYALVVTYGCVFLSMFFVYFAHRKNIWRLIKGEEHPTSVKDMLQKIKKK